MAAQPGQSGIEASSNLVRDSDHRHTTQPCSVPCTGLLCSEAQCEGQKNTKCLQTCGWVVWTILKSFLNLILSFLYVQPDNGYFS